MAQSRHETHRSAEEIVCMVVKKERGKRESGS